MKLTYTETKELISALKDDYCIDNYKEIIENIILLDSDFYSPCNKYRFINSDNIDKIMQDELASDEYYLGCFNVDFISYIIDIDCDVIEEMQKAEAFKAIGKLIISLGKLEELQQDYVNADGYGHHFAHYDHYTNEIYILDKIYYVFKVN